MSRHFIDAKGALVHVLSFLCACAATPRRPGAQAESSCNALKGAWEGTLPLHSGGKGDAAAQGELTLRLTFAGENPKVYSVEEGAWMEAKPGSFRARCLGPSAVVHAIDSARDEDGTWVETWVLAVTVRDPDELLARWIRMVNNVDLPLTKTSSKFSVGGVGILRRVPMPTANPECRQEPADGSTTIGALLERSCDCGKAVSCENLAELLERDGDTASLARAKKLRQKACELGYQPSCVPAR